MANGAGFALFDTAVGRCGIAWTGKGIACTQLPEQGDARTRERLLRSCQEAPEAVPPPNVQRAIDGIVALLGGEKIDLAAIPLDMADVPSFERRVYEITRTIPPGGTLTYGDVAARLGAPGSARAVGQALGRNPWPILVPCHRVLAAGGKAGGFSGSGGVATKRRLLSIEGAQRSLPLESRST
jgi:methylated-DNA-[protein]-cysteine S-methyltransferase